MSSRAFCPWFERDSDRLRWELNLLEEKGWSFSVDEQARRDGRLVLDGQMLIGGDERVLQIVFPETYPEHRVEVYDLTNDAVLPLHQHPYHRNLCLLDNLPEAWTPSDSAAMMIERVLKLREAAEEGIAGLERIGVGAPEPQSYYYPYIDGSAVLIPETLLGMPGDFGRFSFATLSPGGYPLRGLISEVRPHSAQSPTKAPLELARLFSGAVMRGVWFRIASPPPFQTNPEQYRNWAGKGIQNFESRLAQDARTSSSRDYPPLVAFAFVYPDQGPDGEHDAWLVCLTEPGKKRKRFGALLRPFILASKDQERRIASIAGLRGKKVAVVGLGTIGAPVALELAKTGLLDELLLVDFDHYTVWNLVRHPLDLYALGLSKAQAVARQANLHAPFLNVKAVNLRIGEAPRSGDVPSGSLGALLSQLGGFDLIIDATADGGTSRFLNCFSLESGMPLIVSSVTGGALGGEVVRSIPGQTGCYECYLWGIKDRTVPEPDQDPDRALVFTRGCGFPTFTGTGFDALSMAADTARLAVQTLLRAEQAGYANASYDILVRNNGVGIDGAPGPRYQIARLAVHPKCGQHGRSIA